VHRGHAAHCGSELNSELDSELKPEIETELNSEIEPEIGGALALHAVAPRRSLR
jgi:hypothetical protein